jgi:hypothetical protein
MVVVNLSWVVAELAQLDHGEAEVRTAGHHGPDQFLDGLTVGETHGAFKVLAFGVGRRDWGSIEVPECVGGTIHWYRVVDSGTSRVTDPCVGSQDLVGVTRRVKPYVIAGLLDIRSVVQSEKVEPFDRLVKTSVDEITDLLVDVRVIDSHGKVVDSTQQEKSSA